MSGVIEMEKKSIVLQAYENWKKDPRTITPELITKLKEIKEELFTFRQDKSQPLEKRQESFDLQQQIHEIIGYKKMDEKFRPKASSGKKQFYAKTPEKRKENCEAFIKYLEEKNIMDQLKPFELAQVLGGVWGS